MERLVASSDLWPDVTVTGPDGLERTYGIGLEVTYDFDPSSRRMSIAVRGLGHGVGLIDSTEGWVGVFHHTSDPNVVSAFVGFIGTARELTSKMELPESAAFPVSEQLTAMAGRLDPFVQDCFLGRTIDPALEATAVPEQATLPEVPVTPAAETEKPDNVLVCIDRDVSPIFGKPEGTCLIEYRLFSEPRAFRALVVLTNAAGKKKSVECLKKDVSSIIRYLSTDNTAYEVASFLGSTNSHAIYMVSAVLKLALAMNTGLAKEVAAAALTVAIPKAESTRPDYGAGDTQPIAPVPEPSTDTFTVFNNGYFNVTVPTS